MKHGKTLQRIVIRPELNTAPTKPAREMDRLDKKLKATADLVRAEIKSIREMRIEDRKYRAEVRKRRKEFDSKYNALMNSQRKTDQKFDRLIAILSRRKNGNGHNRPN